MRTPRYERVIALTAALALTAAACAADPESAGLGPEAPAEDVEDIEGDDGGTTDDGVEADETVTVGVIGPISGGFSEIGENIVEGAELAVQHINDDGGLLDGTVELEIATRDEGGTPESATQAARDMINAGTPLLAGYLSSANCLAAAPVIDDLGGVLVSSTCSSNDLTGIISGEAPYERSFFLAVRDLQMARGLAQVVAEEYPNVEVFDVFGYDYSVGREMWSVFVDELRTEHGMDVEINQEHFVAFDAADYRSQISAISRGLQGEAETRGLFLSMFGAGTASFIQQSEAFDLTSEYAVMLNSGSYYPVARTLDGTAPEIWSSYDYHPEAFDNDMNERFVSDFETAHGRLPVAWSQQGYSAIRAYAAAIEAAGSTDPDDIAAALSDLEFDTPRGTLFMNGDTHLAESDILIKHTIGSSDAPEGVEFLDAYMVPVEGTLR